MSKAKSRFMWTASASVLIFLSCLFSARPAYGQFDLGIVISMLETIQQTINSTVIPVLNTLNTVNRNMKQFQQGVMYPPTDIQSARGMASGMLGRMGNMQAVLKIPVNSATLPSTKGLESQLLSHNANNFGSLSASFYKVYGALPASTEMDSSLRTATDASDTQAMDAYKRAIALDSISDTEMTLSQQYMQQLQNTAPGNAALIQAQASAWNLQAAAYTQQALSELVRTQAAEMAYTSFNTKNSASVHQQMLKHLGMPTN